MTIEQRLDRIARQNRRLKAALVALVLAAASLLLAGLGQPTTLPAATPDGVPQVVRAKRFEVLNDAGKPVVTLTAWEHGGWIETRDNAGRRLFDVSATDDGAGLLSTYNHDGKDTVALGGVKGGSGLLVIFDGRGGKLIGIGGAEDGAGVIAAYDRAGQIKTSWP